MKHRGDNAPANAFTMEEQPKRPGYVLVRFYENVQAFTETNGDLTISGYEYDEYYLELKYYDGISEDILSGYDNLLNSAKLKEAEEKTIPNLQNQVSTLEAEKAELQERVATLDSSLMDTQMALCDVYEAITGGGV